MALYMSGYREQISLPIGIYWGGTLLRTPFPYATMPAPQTSLWEHEATWHNFWIAQFHWKRNKDFVYSWVGSYEKKK